MSYRSLACCFAAAALLAACHLAGSGSARGTAADPDLLVDHHTQSNAGDVRVRHADIQWTLRFDQRRIDGTVTWHLDRLTGDDDELILDTKALDILRVETGTANGMLPSTYRLGAADPILGRALAIPLRAGDDRVLVRYRTRQEGTALQWLNAKQTGTKRPFVFSQAQAIHARTMLPCQDSPAVRFTFDAAIKTPRGIRPVMAAERRASRASSGAWQFRMRQSIPSYLLAFAAGELEFRALGPRTGVWGRPADLDAAAFEFADTETMLAAAEALYGPYRWGRYELLVMPPSFPFGGMENPRLTFVTPTILAGDRSLVDLVAHELAHAWSGNLVTNATWADFWLNEGFTVYFERRIQEAVYGARRANLEATLGHESLLAEMADLPDEETCLHVDLRGRDPDDGLTAVPYEKGYLFLRTIESVVGRERLDPFLARWFDGNAFESRATPDFENALREELLSSDEIERLDVSGWLYAPGIPDGADVPQSEELRRMDELAARFARNAATIKDLQATGYTEYALWQRFLRALPQDVAVERLAALDEAFGFATTRNREIQATFLTISARRGYVGATRAIYAFVEQVGRRKFLMPLYGALLETEQGTALARECYRLFRPRYHPITQRSLDQLLRRAR